MGFFDFFRSEKKEIKSMYEKSYTNLTVPYTGEKTPYELGVPIPVTPHYDALRLRSWKAFLDTDIVHNAIQKYVLWIIGAGLKLQSNPEETILGMELGDMKNTIEARFRIFADSKYSTYKKDMTLHDLASEALKTAILSGDALCVVRYNRGNVSMQVIDGVFVETPFSSEVDYIRRATRRGNVITKGVEINRRGTPVAYYVRQPNFTYKRIRATNNSGTIMYAWLLKGSRYKLHSVRGMGLLAAVLSSSQKMDRYKEATIGAAEENAKIPYTVEHGKDSDGENPLIGQLAQSLGKGAGTAPETGDNCDVIATKIAQSTEKMVYNLPVGATLKRNAGPTDPQFGNFYTVNLNIIYATLGIPPEVAMDKFDSSYSASRAAIKSWEHKMLVDRTKLVKNQFYKPFYDFWLNIQVLRGTITAPGYLQAFADDDYMTLEAFRKCRFIGATVPHIDPVKEVSAERLKLGKAFEYMPLSTVEQSMEALNTGDFDDMIKKTIMEKGQDKPFNVTTKINSNE